MSKTKPPRAHPRNKPAASLACAGSTSSPHLVTAIEHLPIGALKAYERNAREHNDRQITKLAGIMRDAGFLVPIIVDQGNVIIAGHGRWAAAQQLGLQTVPVIRAAHLTSAQVKAFRLADNRLGELSSWDKGALALELKDLAAIEIDDHILDLTAFETAEIDVHLSALEVVEPSPDKADQLPEVDPNRVVSRPGDLWLMGKHRLLCGSALEAASYDRLLQGERVQAVWSDPPYNVPIGGHVCGLGQTQHREFAMASGEMSEAEFTAFLSTYLSLARHHSKAGALHYVCMDGPHALELLTAARQAELSFKVTCTWAKTNAGMGSLYRQQTEFVHVFKHGGDEVAHVNNIQLGKYGRSRTTLWTYAGVNTFRKGRADDLKAHPTVKPWTMVADVLKDCTHQGDSVLDCFCGSGTTIIAAQKSRRVGYGIELDPLYVDVAIRRWQQLTGEAAVLADTGQSFAQVEVERVTPSRSDATMADDKEAQHG
ncbi:MAG: DNA methyltransferase [Alsobacter sp.]